MLKETYTINILAIELRPKWSYIWLLVGLSLCLSAQQLRSQVVTFDFQMSNTITVCGQAEYFEVTVTNMMNNSLQDVQINLDMPEGIEYVVESVQTLSGQTVTEFTTINLSSPTFAISSIPIGGISSFTVELLAMPEVINATTELRNTISLSSLQGNQSTQSTAYDALYAALSITNVTPLSTTVYAGQTYSRSVTVYNGGYGDLTSFTLMDEHDNNLEIISTDIGSLNAQIGHIVLTSADFLNIGDGDGYFEQDESITITLTITAIGCNDASSTLTAVWGCNEEMLESNRKYPYTTVNLRQPSLSITANSAFDNCFGGTSQTQQLIITNNGSGPANEVELMVNNIAPDVYSWIDANSFKIQQNGGAIIGMSPANTTVAISHDCMPDNVFSSLSFDLPLIDPGTQLLVSWEMITCSAIPCYDVDIAGWNWQLDYTDMCESRSYQKNENGLSAISKNVDFFIESPSDLNDGEWGAISVHAY